MSPISLRPAALSKARDDIEASPFMYCPSRTRSAERSAATLDMVLSSRPRACRSRFPTEASMTSALAVPLSPMSAATFASSSRLGSVLESDILARPPARDPLAPIE